MYLTVDDRFRFGGIVLGFGTQVKLRYRCSYGKLSGHEVDCAVKTNYGKGAVWWEAHYFSWVCKNRILGRPEDPPSGHTGQDISCQQSHDYSARKPPRPTQKPHGLLTVTPG